MTEPDADALPPSPFLAFVAAEFNRRGTGERKVLGGKVGAHAAATELGLRAPRRHAVIDDIADLAPDMLGERCVLKPAEGWASRGVMLLERLGEGRWFDHLAARARTFPEILAAQRKVKASFDAGRWPYVVEEMIGSTLAGRPIPFDYKFYCFRERIGMIVQIDRNAYPPRLALLRPDWSPLLAGQDYAFARTSVQQGQGVVPLHAAEMAQWAAICSLRTDSPFVSVDLYDSPDGPVFGEFTFSPGGTHRAMWSYAPRTLARLDRLFQRRSAETVDSFRAAMPDLSGLPTVAPDVFARLGAATANGHARAAQTLADFHSEAARSAPAHQAGVLRGIAGAWAATRRANRAMVRDRVLPAIELARSWDTGQEVPEPPEPPAAPPAAKGRRRPLGGGARGA